MRIIGTFLTFITFLNYYFRLKCFLKNRTRYFFFPSFATGGATKVHRDIIKSFDDDISIVIFCRWSENNKFKSDFYNNASCIELWKISTKNNWYKTIIEDLIIQNLNSATPKKIVGSNCDFFYNLIQKIENNNCEIYDIIHGYVNDGINGVIKWNIDNSNRIHKTIVVSNHIKYKLIEHYKKTNFNSNFDNKIVVIPNKVNCPEKNVQKKFNGKINILYAGRYCNNFKNINAFFEVAKQFINDERVNFYAAGFDSNKLKPDQRNICEILGPLSEKELNSLFEKCHILISPSSYESFGLSNLEAMSYGLVVIASNVGGVGEHISNDINGKLIEFKSQKHLLESIVKQIHDLIENREKLTRISLNAINYTIKKFKNNNFENSYKNLLIEYRG